MSECATSEVGLGNKTKIGWRHLRQRILLEKRSRSLKSRDILERKAEECSKGLGGHGGELDLPPEGTGEPWQVLSWRGTGAVCALASPLWLPSCPVGWGVADGKRTGCDWGERGPGPEQGLGEDSRNPPANAQTSLLFLPLGKELRSTTTRGQPRPNLSASFPRVGRFTPCFAGEGWELSVGPPG